MPTFSQVKKGTYARRTLTIDINGEKVAIDIRVLSSDEEADVMKGARAYAADHGAPNPGDGDAVYELGIWMYTAASACIDPESPADAPRPFFDGGVEQIRNTPLLTRTHLGYLFEHQEAWQNEVSPFERVLTDEQLMARIHPIANGDLRPFVALPPSMRWLFVRGLAARHVTLLAAKLLSGGASETANDEKTRNAEA